MEIKIKAKRRAFIHTDVCVACGCCAKVCPVSAIEVWRGIRAVVNGEVCVGCGRCERECPASVIELQEVQL